MLFCSKLCEFFKQLKAAMLAYSVPHNEKSPKEPSFQKRILGFSDIFQRLLDSIVKCHNLMLPVIC